MTFNSLIVIWFDNNKRILPWRSGNDPYKVWLSEIILQQTRVSQGTLYYERFCEAFPLLQNLAEASEQEVLKLWQGLGYYSRARNLLATAKHIYYDLNGKVPDNFEDLKKLKGIGDYTAAAIASICFDEAVPAIDGNVFRVYARYFNIDMDISKPKTRKYFFELGLELIDKKRPGDFNQAVMELGATVCTPTNPNCLDCPLNQSCEALAKKTVNLLPVKSKNVKIRQRHFHFLEISDGKQILVKKRSTNDVWKNLYNFPIVEISDQRELGEFFASCGISPIKNSEEIHLLSHQRLFITFWKLQSNEAELEKLAQLLKAEIFRLEELEKLPVPRPMEKHIQKKLKQTTNAKFVSLK